MIITITLNPAIDRTIRLDEIKLGMLNRSKSAITDIGGKGINVSRAINALGGESLAMGFCAGSNGNYFKDRLKALGIHYDLIDVPGQIRTNIKLVDDTGEHTDINEPGFHVGDADFLRLRDRIAMYACSKSLFVLSGSIPPNTSQAMIKKICRVISSNNSRFILDMTDESLITALAFKPFIVKPNKAELSQVCGFEITSVEDAVRGANKLVELGAQNVCVSLGELGAVFVFEKQAPFYIKPCTVNPIGPVGAGDAMVGALAHAANNAMAFEDMARFATAMGSASTALEGCKMATLKETFQIYEKCALYDL